MKNILLLLLLLLIILLGIYFKERNIYQAEKESIDANVTTNQKEKNMEKNISINEQWQRLFNYYRSNGLLLKKCKGASEEQIMEFENEFKIKLPKTFAESLKICDERYILNSSKKVGWLGEDDMYSLTNRKYDWYNLFQVNRQIATYAKDIGWNKNWIQFYDYGTWFSAVLDTVTGKIYCYENETGAYVLWANSYEEWLEMAVDEVVKYGELRLETIEKLLGIE
jgi:hypothetical protein